MPTDVLDLRTTKCPLNFVKARLAVEKLADGDTLTLWLASDSESAVNVPQSLQQEGHTVLEQTSLPNGEGVELHVQRGRL